MDELSVLIKKYVDATIIHSVESNGGDHRVANKNYEIAVNCLCEIKNLDEWKNVFVNLLDHENTSVRVSAACYLLPYKTQLAIKTLKNCRSAPNGVGFTAKMILQEWESGNLMFPEFENGKIVYK